MAGVCEAACLGLLGKAIVKRTRDRGDARIAAAARFGLVAVFIRL